MAAMEAISHFSFVSLSSQRNPRLAIIYLNEVNTKLTCVLMALFHIGSCRTSSSLQISHNYFWRYPEDVLSLFPRSSSYYYWCLPFSLPPFSPSPAVTGTWGCLMLRSLLSVGHMKVPMPSVSGSHRCPAHLLKAALMEMALLLFGHCSFVSVISFSY